MGFVPEIKYLVSCILLRTLLRNQTTQFKVVQVPNSFRTYSESDYYNALGAVSLGPWMLSYAVLTMTIIRYSNYCKRRH